MEGAGSRLSRASSRYGPTTTVFSGPVRRWKKKWVHVPPSPSSAFSSRSQSNSRNNNDNNSRLLLCRWTPISSAATADPAEDRPRRRFRYAPVAALEDQKKSVEKKIEEMEDVENTSEVEQSTVLSDMMFGKSNMDQIKNQEAEKLGSTSSHLNLDLGLQGHSANLELMNKMKGAQTKTTSSGGFWLQ